MSNSAALNAEKIEINPQNITDNLRSLTTNINSEVHFVKKEEKVSLPDIITDIVDTVECFDSEEKWKRAVREESNSSFTKTRAVELIAVSIEVERAIKISYGVQYHDKTNKLFLYNGCFWENIDDSDLADLLQDCALRIGVAYVRVVNKDFKKDLSEQFKSLVRVREPKPVKEIKINLLNGTFEVGEAKTKLRSFKQEDFFTYQLSFKYDRTAKCERFKKYLDMVLPDKDSQKVLAEYLGSTFIKQSEVKIERAAFLYGSGGNGKGVLYDIVLALFGKQNITSCALETLTDENSFERSKIEYKLFNFCSDISTKINAAGFKQLTSLEPVHVKIKYRDSYEMLDYARLMFNCNKLPIAPETTEGYYRRFLIFPFNKAITKKEKDTSLSTKIIKNELSGVFNWVLDGMQRVRKNKELTYSQELEDELKKYKLASNNAAMFISENNYIPSVKETLSVANLYSTYCAYCHENGFKCLSRSNFEARIEKLGFPKFRASDCMRIRISKKDNLNNHNV